MELETTIDYARQHDLLHLNVLKAIDQKLKTDPDFADYVTLTRKKPLLFRKSVCYVLTEQAKDFLDRTFLNNKEEIQAVNDEQLFNGQFGALTVVVADNKPWFKLADVCKALDLTNSRVVSLTIREADKRKFNLHSAGSSPTFVNESGLYKCIFSSRKPEAERFQYWVIDEVIPSVIRYGFYGTPMTIEKMISDPETAITMLKALQEERKKVATLSIDNAHKQAVIDNFAVDVPTASKRQVINMVVRKAGDGFKERWRNLYSIFDKTYHKNTKLLVKNYNLKNNKSLSRLDYIDEIGMIDQLYAIAVKLYEADVNIIIKQMFGNITTA